MISSFDRDWAAVALSPRTKQIELFTVEHDRAILGVWVVEDQNGSDTVQRFFTGEGALIATGAFPNPSSSGAWSDVRGSLLQCGAPDAHDDSLLEGRSHIVISRGRRNSAYCVPRGRRRS
jgi:hypothetical protein